MLTLAKPHHLEPFLTPKHIEWLTPWDSRTHTCFASIWSPLWQYHRAPWPLGPTWLGFTCPVNLLPRLIPCDPFQPHGAPTNNSRDLQDFTSIKTRLEVDKQLTLFGTFLLKILTNATLGSFNT